MKHVLGLALLLSAWGIAYSDGLLKGHRHRVLPDACEPGYQWVEETVGSSRVDLQACKLEYSIVSPK